MFNAPAGRSDGTAQKRRFGEQKGAKKEHTADDLPKEAMVKGILKCLQDGRILRSIVLECIELPTDNKYVLAASHATQHYMELAKSYANTEGEKKNKEIGQPHYHVWSGWMCALETELKEKGREEEAKKVHDYCQKFKQMGEQGILLAMDQVKYAYKAKTNLGGRKRLEMATVPSTESSEMMALLVQQLRQQENARVPPGRAPKGAQERELQRWLDETQL
eukprot:TRINITY_DN58950_c0_g1_i1.p2 TRINITY_DN58950_c0_g1~~TRINITY_DN58950_c0_g1_i1.p2  ORF type:complete len:220 (-),score=56.63 TRINITY_DN58950_c0_g1_i1:321-980(-)